MIGGVEIVWCRLYQQKLDSKLVEQTMSHRNTDASYIDNDNEGLKTQATKHLNIML